MADKSNFIFKTKKIVFITFKVLQIKIFIYLCKAKGITEKMVHLQNKSNILSDAAKLLHEKCLYPAVAHGAYYSCYQLSKHIWLYKIGKTQQDLDTLCTHSRYGSHEVLINEIGKYIKDAGRKDSYRQARDFKTNILQLKSLRRQADYDDSIFDSSKSQMAISLSDFIIPVLKLYI